VLLLSQYVEAEYALRPFDGNEHRAVPQELHHAALVSRRRHAERLRQPVRHPRSALVSQLLDRSRAHNPLDQLTRREREVLSLMAEGLTDRGIAERLFVTLNTVETHIRHIISKLGLPATPADNRRVRAVLAYLRSG
jgi:DNA-binding NarL/FixJ family response regulator